MKEVKPVQAAVSKPRKKAATKPDIDALTPGLRAVLEAFESYLRSLDKDIKVKDTKYYRGYWRGKRFAAIQAWQGQLTLYLLLDRVVGDKLLAADSLTDIARHNPDNELVVTLKSLGDLDKVKPVVASTYHAKAESSGLSSPMQ